jgi:hypothetical protein
MANPNVGMMYPVFAPITTHTDGSMPTYGTGKVIQEARNGKRKARIFVNRHATSLYSKAQTLRGYTSIFESPDEADRILEAVGDVWKEMQTDK